MNELTNELQVVYRLLSSISVRGDDVDALAAARVKVRLLIEAGKEVAKDDV